ncbi:MAG: flagellar filament outer layer protein FlaA [Spirochaetes bacterium]|nr:flagellar filament outer layer protein FlaA [Spirochaetota bacterium]
MKRINFIFVLILSLCLILNTVSAQQPESQKGEELGGMYFPKESSKQKLEIVLVEDFENCDSWMAKMPIDQGFARAKKVQGASDQVKQKFANNSKFCLGIKEWSYKRGFNWLEIKPPSPIAIVGKLKGLLIWAVGRNFRHRLEIWVKNYQGIEYPIDMGSLNFRGWRRMSARIPMYIPYYTKYIPQYKVMHVTRFIIRHDPDEKNGEFYVYMDNLEAVVDTYEDTYDGDDMINEMGEERWEEIEAKEIEKKAGSSTTGGGQ